MWKKLYKKFYRYMICCIINSVMFSIYNFSFMLTIYSMHVSIYYNVLPEGIRVFNLLENTFETIKLPEAPVKFVLNLRDNY